MFNKLIAACASIALTAIPSHSTIDEGTPRLINRIDESDIVLTINGVYCNSEEYLGVYVHKG